MSRPCRLFVLLILAVGLLGAANAATKNAKATKADQQNDPSSTQPGADSFVQGFAQWKQGDMDAAIASFTKAIEASHGEAKFLLTRGLAYFDNEDLDSAIADFSTVLKKDQDDTSFHFGPANCLCCPRGFNS